MSQKDFDMLCREYQRLQNEVRQRDAALRFEYEIVKGKLVKIDE